MLFFPIIFRCMFGLCQMQQKGIDFQLAFQSLCDVKCRPLLQVFCEFQIVKNVVGITGCFRLLCFANSRRLNETRQRALSLTSTKQTSCDQEMQSYRRELFIITVFQCITTLVSLHPASCAYGRFDSDVSGADAPMLPQAQSSSFGRRVTYRCCEDAEELGAG